MGPLDRHKPVFAAPKGSGRDEAPSGKSVSEAASGANVEIPPELMGRMSLSLSDPNNFIFVRNAVSKFNQGIATAGIGTAIDPIDVANALIQKGYNIVAIPERKVEITPTPEGLILDKKQIQQILNESRVSEFPVLEFAAQCVRNIAILDDGSLQIEKDRINRVMENMNERADKLGNEKLRGSFEEYLLSTALTNVRYDRVYRDTDSDEQKVFAGNIAKQMVFLFDNFERADDLLSKQQVAERKQRVEETEQDERGARSRRREELFESKEAAGRWLYGVARGELQRVDGDVEQAIRNLSQNGRAGELIKHHNIDLFQYVDEQLKGAQEREQGRGRRRDRGYVQLPVAVLLGTFAKPRTIDDSPNSIRERPDDYLYRVINLWLGARFTAELPDGVYDEVIAGEEGYRQERMRFSREQDLFLEQVFGKFGKDVPHREKESSLRRDSSVAVLWWTLPLWKQWKFLRPHIREEMRKTQGQSRGFTPRKFFEHIGGLINEENRNIKLQNALLASLEKGDKKAALEGYWKEIMELGKPSDEKRAAMGRYQDEAEQDFPTEERAREIIGGSRERMRRLEEVKDLFNVDFVMSKPERDAEIEKRQKERASRQLPRFRW